MNTSMPARLRDYRLLWRAAVTHANPRLSAISRWSSAPIAIAIGAVVAYNDGPRAALAWFWSAASAFLLMSWAWRFMPGAVKLNTPANAKLVPQMRRRLVELSCLVCFVGIAGIASAPYADASHLGGWLFWIVFLVVGTGLATAGHQAGSALIMAACFTSIFVDELPATLGAMLSHPLAVLLSLPLYAGVIVVAVRAMFPQGGEQHWNMLARRARWATAAGKRDPLVEQVGGAQARGWYADSLRRHSARRDSPRLLLHALGPAHHLSEMLIALGVLSAIVLAVGMLTAWRVDFDVVQGIGWLFASMLLIVPLSHSLRLGQHSGSHAGEQALARLAPAAPASSAAFNEQLGRALVRQVATGWLLTAGAALLLVTLGGARAPALLDMASICCLVLPIIALPLRNHALRSPWSAMVAVALLLVSAAASMLLGLAASAIAGLSLLPVAALASIAFSLLAVMLRLRALRRMPCAFPAARID